LVPSKTCLRGTIRCQPVGESRTRHFTEWRPAAALCSSEVTDGPPSVSCALGQMKALLAFTLSILLVGCMHLPSRNDFVQGWTRITPPIERETKNGKIIHYTSLSDGGTKCGCFIDAKGRRVDYYIDYRIGTKTPGDIYLYHYPDEFFWSYVHIKDKAEFIRKLGHEDWFQ